MALSPDTKPLLYAAMDDGWFAPERKKDEPPKPLLISEINALVAAMKDDEISARLTMYRVKKIAQIDTMIGQVQKQLEILEGKKSILENTLIATV